MELTRGTTPTITITIVDDIDLTQVIQVWVYISQQQSVKVDKTMDDVVINSENKTIAVTLTQKDTLKLRAADAIFQIRMLLNDGTALATTGGTITVNEVYKGGEITI